MSEQTQTFKIAKIPADGVGKEVVEAGQRVLDAVAGQSAGQFAFSACTPTPGGSRRRSKIATATGHVTRDVGGTADTAEVADAIIEALQRRLATPVRP